MASSIEDNEINDASSRLALFASLRRRWEYVVFGTCLGLALASLYYFTTIPMYQSDIEILVGQRSSELTNSGMINGANVNGESLEEDQLSTHMEILISRKLLADAIQIKNLKSLNSFRLAAAAGIGPIDHIVDHISVQRGGEGKARDAMVLRASFRDPKPEDAATVLAAVFESYRNYVESHGENSSQKAVKLIEDARQIHELELANADSEYRNFLQSVPALLDGEKVQDVHKERMTKLEIELNLVNNSLAEQRSRLEVIESFLATKADESQNQFNFLALLSMKEVERLKLFLDMTRSEVQSEAFQAEQPIRQEAARVQYNSLLELIQKERTLSDAFGASHPLVDVARKEIETTRQFMLSNAPVAAEISARKLDPAEMLKTYVLLLRNDIAEYEKRKTILMNDSAKELLAAKFVENDFMRGTSLRAKLNRAQSRYDQVILRLQELNLSKSYAGFSTDLLTTPEPAKKASWPKLSILAGLGLFLGLIFGGSMALIADMVDATFTSAEDIEHATQSTVIAHVPRFSSKKLRKQIAKNSTVAAALVSYHAPRSAEAEIYRVARTSLLISNRKESVRTMMMTSPQPGDGKSTTVANLAVSFARTGKRVLLIDADLRRPMVSSLFGIADRPGLADLLENGLSLQECVAPSALPNLHLMLNGKLTSEPAELLQSVRFEALLLEAKSEYDLILIDAPPLLAVADPSIIAPFVDSVILTIRVTKNGRRPVEQAIKLLADIEIQPTAVIVNGVEKSANKSYGYGTYSGDPYGYVGKYHSSYSAQDTIAVNPSPNVLVGTSHAR